MRRPAYLAATVLLAIATLTIMEPVAATAGTSASLSSTSNVSGPLSTPEPCPGTPLSVALGTTTPVLLVHGFNEWPSVFTSGSPSLVDAIHTALGGQITTAIFDYHLANRSWVTDRAIGPLLAGCITWLAQRSKVLGGPGKVIIIAHSMGGLAVRCAVDPACVKGASEGPAADPKLIGLVITLGTPNLGSNPQTLGSINDAICSAIPPCAAWLNLRNTPAAKAMAQGSSALAALPLLPVSVPVDAIAGDITFTTNLFGVAYAGLSLTVKDEGDLIVPVFSALADAKSGALHAGPGANKTLVNCGSVPLADLDPWLIESGVLHAFAPPVSCWHLTETTDPVWQGDITAAVRLAAKALSLRACTPTAISTALATTDPVNAEQRTLVKYACQSGWALASISQPLTLSDGSVVQDTGVAVLQQAAAKWVSGGISDGTCLVDRSQCPGVLLPPPDVLQSLLQKTGLSPAMPHAELYINTVFTPGALYTYPTGPATIGLDNHDYITGLQWASGSQGDLIGTGTLHWDDCTPDCASGTYHEVPVRITASNPKQCTAKLYPQGQGNPSQTVQAEAFDTIDVTAIQGSLPPSMYFDAMLVGLTCT